METPGIGKKSKKTNALAIILIALAAAVILSLLLGFGLFARMRKNAATVAVMSDASQKDGAAMDDADAGQGLTGADTPIYQVAPRDENVVNILLIGTDSRAARGAHISGNADAVMLASFDQAAGRVTLVSFMRDAVLIFGDADDDYTKLKTVFRTNGAGGLINTINGFFELDIQGYVAVGLEGFAAFVDETLGGLDVTLTKADIDYINTRITEYENESDLVKNCPLITDPPGEIHLNGAQALIFVRNRSTAISGAADGGDDYDRTARQQHVIQLMYDRFVSVQPLSALPGVLRFALGHVETNLTFDELSRFAQQLMTREIDMETASVPFPGTWSYGGDGSGILFERAATVQRLHGMLYGTHG